jgi:hypothetical protein
MGRSIAVLFREDNLVRDIGERHTTPSRGNDDPLPLSILELRAQIAALSGTIRQLQRAGLDDAVPRLLISRKRAELEDLSHRANRRSAEG